MSNLSSRSESKLPQRLAGTVPLVILAVFALGLSQIPSRAQSQAPEDLGGCTLKDHVYHCDGAVFQKALNDASKIQIETHNADGVARDRLTDFVTSKLGKTVVPPGSPADLSFLMLPVDDPGNHVSGDVGGTNLGTLRIYTVTPSGSAAICSGRRLLPDRTICLGRP